MTRCHFLTTPWLNTTQIICTSVEHEHGKRLERRAIMCKGGAHHRESTKELYARLEKGCASQKMAFSNWRCPSDEGEIFHGGRPCGNTSAVHLAVSETGPMRQAVSCFAPEFLVVVPSIWWCSSTCWRLQRYTCDFRSATRVVRVAEFSGNTTDSSRAAVAPTVVEAKPPNKVETSR